MSEKNDDVVFYNPDASSKRRSSVSASDSETVILPPSAAGALRSPSAEKKNDVCIDVNDVSIMFNLSKNREEGVKEYFINIIKGKVGYNEFWAVRNVSFQVKRGE